jgi:D-aminoacyl-tRNA deacylase
MGNFLEIGTFHDRPVRFGHGLLLYEKEGMHLYLDNIDLEIRRNIDNDLSGVIDIRAAGSAPLDLLVFLSKHSSEKRVRSLTVHPPGNYLSADHGGRPGYLPPSAPYEMTSALKALYREKRALGIGDQTTYEVTHHGPILSSPCFFIEIGSDPTRWGIPLLGEAIARALISGDVLYPDRGLPVAIGLGGGHYAPRFTDRAMRKKYAFGHMIPDYVLTGERDIAELMELAKESTEGAEYVFVHRSKRNESILKDIEDASEQVGLIAVGL